MRFNVQRFAEFQRGYSSNLMTLKLNYFIDFFFFFFVSFIRDSFNPTMGTEHFYSL